MTIAIAILNYNGKHWLKRFLPNIIRYSKEAKIYVIDNASTDNSIALLEEKFPEISIVKNKKNTGFAGGYNEGLQHIKEDIFCLLNSDVEVTENWLVPVMDLFQKNQNIAAIQPKILDFNNEQYFEFAGAGGGMMDNLGYPYCRGRRFDDLEKDQGQYDDVKEIFWASGCCLFIRREDFFNIGGFDERFFAHQEEIDLCWRLKNKGRLVFYTGYSRVYHVGGGTLNKQHPQKTYLNIRNNLSMLLKNLPKSKLWLIFPRLCLDGLAGIYFGIKNGFPHLWAVVRAHFAFYTQAPETWKRRDKHQTQNYYQDQWIVVKYFITDRFK